MRTHAHTTLIPDILRNNGFRVTHTRVRLLKLLEEAGTPLSIQMILSRWVKSPPDQTTLYRSLTDLSTAGIVRRIDLNTGIAHFEYTPDRPHHHHVICTDCGTIEEIQRCSVGTLEKKIMSESSLFSEINTHNLEFFGRCNTCITQ